MTRRFFLGAVHRQAPQRTPRLASLSLFETPPPAEVNYHAAIDLSKRNALGNDKVGSCVPCAALRGVQIRRATFWHDEWEPTEALSMGLYQDWTPYDPAKPGSDRGTDTVDACTRRVTKGIRLTDSLLDIGPWFVLDPRNIDHVKIAIDKARAVELTLALPMSAMDVSTGRWDIVPGSPHDGDHRVVSGRYDAGGIWVITWGFEMYMPWAAYLAWVLAADVVLSLECLPSWADRGVMEAAMEAVS
jgi:hypothetical protein